MRDDQLIERYLRGDSEAVAVVDEWLRRAASSYRRRLREHWDDVLQDVRLEVTRLLRQGKFRGESSLKTYLWRVTGHTCLDRLRARQRSRVVELDSDLTEGDHAEEMAAPPRGWNAERDLLLRVLARMDEDCRRLWGMLIEGRSYREMSAETGVSEGALRVRVLRCRKRATEVRDDLLAGETTSG
ncbi:MAG TPA: sigma-70 family RNA polymerase sigma factor [Thermoanaerobaculia bacterium]|nr:sigma-70 family RNA polymerase sigma factor [Thermoanaerobaculia bacterium]